MQDLDVIFSKLATSPFRSRFKLREKERELLSKKRFGTILDHARAFIADRLAPSCPKNDGRQTPMRGHPVFVAQHATATCCRSCLSKWHGIPAGRALSQAEQEHVLEAIKRWIELQTC
jgi:hypothetical protein